MGQYYTGQINYITFINDHDVKNPTATSQFGNIRVYEDPKLLRVTTIENGTETTQEDFLTSYGGGQDKKTFYEITADGNFLSLTGNTWKAFKYNYNITPDTVVEFDFQSAVEGEIHTIGFDFDTSLTGNQQFQLHGTQHWTRANQDFTYDEITGGLQHYRIPVGQYYTGQVNYITFINDHDVKNPTATSQFGNIRIYENSHSSVSATLTNDTGSDTTDKITSDPTIRGTITSNTQIASLQGKFGGEFKEITAQIQPNGSFTLTRSELAGIYGENLPDGTYTLQLTATDINGEKSPTFHLTFTLDTTKPDLFLETPISEGSHSNTVEITGTIIEGAKLQFVLNGGTPIILNLDENGKFDAPLPIFTTGNHTLVLTGYDIAGNSTSKTVEFVVNDAILVAPQETTGWGITTTNKVILQERDSFVVQGTIPVELGVEEGTRTLKFDLESNWDRSDTTGKLSDTLIVSLLNQNSRENLFSLTETGPSYTPGLVSYDGKTVAIDLTSFPENGSGELIFQLLNQDGDTGSLIEISNISNIVSSEETVSPTFPTNSPTTPGEELELTGLKITENVAILFQNQELNVATGEYTTEVQIQNNGPAISRNVAIVFPNLPEGVALVNASGSDENGNPYVNFYNSIPTGGLSTGKLSDPVEVKFTNSNLVSFNFNPKILVGGPNIAPNFPTLSSFTVKPGERLTIL